MATSRRKTIRPPRGIDLDAIVCLDTGHHWQLVETHSTERGPLKGTPRRIKMCMTCTSLKAEVVGWDGHIITREYQSDDVYLANCRKLGGEVNERRAEYRKILISKQHGKKHYGS